MFNVLPGAAYGRGCGEGGGGVESMQCNISLVSVWRLSSLTTQWGMHVVTKNLHFLIQFWKANVWTYSAAI